MSKEEFEKIATELGIKFPGTLTEDNKYVIEIPDSDEYSKIYSLLDNSHVLELNPDVTLLNEDISQLLYVGDNFMVKLIGNFKENQYKVIIEEAED